MIGLPSGDVTSPLERRARSQRKHVRLGLRDSRTAIHVTGFGLRCGVGVHEGGLEAIATYLRAQTVIPSASGLTRNQVVWTHHFTNPGVGADRTADAQAIMVRVKTLLDWLAPPTLNGSYGHGSSLRHAQAVTSVFDLMEPKPRVPILVQTHSTALSPIATGQDFPPEVAVCVSYQASRVSGVPQNRRRGRTYLGPLQYLSGTSVDLLSPATQQVQGLLDGFKASLDPGTAGQTEFAILSRQTWAGLEVGQKPPPDPNTGEIIFPEIAENLPAAMVQVSSWWADNAWDTQRRRGVDATARTIPTLGFTIDQR